MITVKLSHKTLFERFTFYARIERLKGDPERRFDPVFKENLIYVYC